MPIAETPSKGTGQNSSSWPVDNLTLAIIGFVLVLVGGVGKLRYSRTSSMRMPIKRVKLASSDDQAVFDDSVGSSSKRGEVSKCAGNSTKKCRVELELEHLDVQSFYLPLSVVRLGSAALKEAILEACFAHIGPEGIPASWAEGDLHRMVVQFDEEVRIVPSNDTLVAFSPSCASTLTSLFYACSCL